MGEKEKGIIKGEVNLAFDSTDTKVSLFQMIFVFFLIGSNTKK